MLEEHILTQLHLEGITSRKQTSCAIEEVNMSQPKLVLLFTGKGVASAESITTLDTTRKLSASVFGKHYSLKDNELYKSNYYASITPLTMNAPNVSIYIISDLKRTKSEISKILETCILQALLVSAQTTPESLPSERTLGNNLNELILP